MVTAKLPSLVGKELSKQLITHGYLVQPTQHLNHAKSISHTFQSYLLQKC